MEARKEGRRRSKNLDRFSDLPDSIIQEILCFLDTKEAIKTCVLSKRWKTMWTSLSDLRFRDSSFSSKSRFTQFINKVLSTRDDSSVRELRFVSRWIPKDSLFHKIINYAVFHNVQRLHVHCFSLCVPLTPALLVCESLRTLKISGFQFKDIQSSDFGLTRLTSLSLHQCTFNFLGGICDPFAFCPNLKNLFLDTCFFHDIKILKISGPQLLNLEFERADSKPCYKVEIVAPKLESFIIRQYSTALLDFSELDLPSLNHVDVYSISRNKALRDNVYLINLFRGLYNAKSLKLCSGTIEALNLHPGLLEQQPSPFKRLKSLKVTYRSSDHSFAIPVNVIAYLLGGTPHADSIRVDYISKGVS